METKGEGEKKRCWLLLLAWLGKRARALFLLPASLPRLYSKRATQRKGSGIYTRREGWREEDEEEEGGRGRKRIAQADVTFVVPRVF